MTADKLERAAAHLREREHELAALVRAAEAKRDQVSDPESLEALIEHVEFLRKKWESVKHDLGIVDSVIAERRGLQATASSAHNVDVTKAQKQRRGNSVARSKAKKGGSPVAIAIAASKWKNSGRYAKERARVSQPSMSRYITGSLECPPEVADKVREDFGLGDDAWPRPPSRR